MCCNTKEKIALAVKELMRQKSIRKITVQDIMEETGMKRQSFYYHFQDLMDVVEWSANQAAELMVERSLKAGTYRGALAELIRSTAENRVLLHKLIESQRRAQVERILFKAVRTYLETVLRRKPPELRTEYQDAELALEFLSFGLAGVLFEHCGDRDLDPDKLAEQLVRILKDKL